MEKVCVDCGKPFSAYNGLQVRCKECQLKKRRMVQKKYLSGNNYWNKYSTNSHQSRYYQYARFVETLSDDDIPALISKYIQGLCYVNEGKKKVLRTYIKILQTEYSKREGDRIIALDDALENEGVLDK